MEPEKPSSCGIKQKLVSFYISPTEQLHKKNTWKDRRSRCRLVKAQYFMSLQEQGRGRTGSLPGGNSISREEDEEIVFPGGRKGNFEHPTVPKSIAKCFTLLTVRKN